MPGKLKTVRKEENFSEILYFPVIYRFEYNYIPIASNNFRLNTDCFSKYSFFPPNIQKFLS